MAFTVLPFQLFGFRVMGDVNGITCYTNKKFQKVFYEKAPPDKPPSPAQIIQRSRFRTAVQTWRALSDDDKLRLETAVKRTSLCLTGQNLYVSCAMKHKPDVYETVGRQAGVTLPPLVFIT